MTTTIHPRGATVLSTRNVTRAYGRGENTFSALKGVSLDIRAGESVAVVGKSGSGKSTLLHLLALLDRPSTGSVAVHGQPVHSLGATELNQLRNATFGFVFQQFFLVPNQSVLSNVMLPLAIAGVRRGERRARALEALDRLGLADKAHNKATALSGGQKQRAAIARALVGGPSIIFADEPTGNLDSATGAAVEAELFDLHRTDGITLVVVTHDDDLASRCERRITIADGRLADPVPSGAVAA